MKPITIIFLLSTLLLIFASENERLSNKRFFSLKTSPIEKWLKREIKKIHGDEDSWRLHYSMITGKKNVLRKKQKLLFKNLSLQHLLTPSGLHLSTIYWPLKKTLQYLTKPYLVIILFVIFYLILYKHGYNSLCRMILFKANFILFSGSGDSKKNIWTIFIITFVFELLWGTFKSSPLSYAFSFLYLGTVLTVKSQGIRNLFIPIFCCGILTCSLLEQAFNPFFIFGNLIGTSIFILFFPLIILTSALPIFQFLAKFLVEVFYDSIFYLHNFTPKDINIHIHPMWLFLIFILFENKKRQDIMFLTLLLPSVLF